ncbi:MAG: hypothetical protein ABI047_07630 [Jatrophihabitantaceae bacterium]
MAVPGFNADILDRSTGAWMRGDQVRPTISRLRQLDVVPASCFGECFQDCIADGGMSKAGCSALCTVECGGKPPDNPPYVCTPTDNSVNHALCTLAMDAWLAAAKAECDLLRVIPVGGPILAAACVTAAVAVADKSKADCPPAIICV